MSKPVRAAILIVVALIVVLIVNAMDASNRSAGVQIAVLAIILGLVWLAQRFWKTGTLR